MAFLQRRLGALRQKEHFGRLWKFASVSVISTGLTQIVLFGTYQVLKLGSAVECNVIATVVASVPAYFLNRNWTWGKRGKSDLWREVIPFWVIAFVGLVLSTAMVALAAKHNPFPHGSLKAALFVNLANLCTYGLIWVGRYFIFNRYMFGDRHPATAEVLEDAELHRAAVVMAKPSEAELAALARANGHDYVDGHVVEPVDPAGTPAPATRETVDPAH